jgi:hypothetical protein
MGRKVRWFLGALGGLTVLVAATAGTMGCGQRSWYPDTTDHTVTVQVETASRVPVVGAVVTVWIVDVDLAGPERSAIVLGTAPTESDGAVRFTFSAVDPPYVCGYRVMDETATTLLAEQSPAVTKQLSTPSGYVTVVLP